MIDEFEGLLRSGVWLGPAVLGALVCRLFEGTTVSASGDDFAGAVLLATSMLLLTAAGVRFNEGKNAAIIPAVFAAMFVATWSMQ